MTNPTPQLGASLHGPGGLLATPGLGARRKGKRWGQRLKAKQIVGNLFRGNDGQFQAGGGGPAAAPAAKPADARRQRTEERRTSRAERADSRREARDTGQAEEDRVRVEEDARVASGGTPKDRAALRREVSAERRKRVAARRNAARQASAEERMARSQEDAAERAQRVADAERAAAEKPKGGGGGGGKAKLSDEDKQREAQAKRRQTANQTAVAVGQDSTFVNGLRGAAEGRLTGPAPRLEALGFAKDGEATDQGVRALRALERGDIVGYNAAVQDAKGRMGRETAAAGRRAATEQRRADAEAKRGAAAAERQGKTNQGLSRLQGRARAGQKLTQSQRDTLTDAGLAEESEGAWRLKVYKDHAGAYRWLARTTTAYRDRDLEILSTAALDADSQRMTQAGQFGPLRYWHIGQPDPLSVTAPWGPGVDIGDCDYSVLIGRTRIEGGTFRDPAIAQKVAAQADRYELSPGFFHPLDQPDAAGVFSAIRTFERSLVPMRYGRAANLYTGLSVKEHRMDPDEMERRFKAAITDLGLNAAQAQALGQQLIQTEKAAAAQGVAFKSQDATPGEITINGVVYTVKAAMPAALAEEASAEPAAEAKAGGDEVLAEEIATVEEPAGTYVGDLTPDEFFARLTELLAPVLKMQDMVKSIGDMTGDLKSMYGGTATKAASELATLKAQQAELAQKIAAIEGGQPNTILPAELAAALKSEGPQTPADPTAPVVPDDPNRPWAGWGALTFPQLYQPGN